MPNHDVPDGSLGVSDRKAFTWRVWLICLSMAAAIAVYCFARFNPPVLLETFQATYPALASQTHLFGSAPSFLYTLSIALLVGACATTRSTGLCGWRHPLRRAPRVGLW